MDRLLKLLRINSSRQILIAGLIITAISVAAPVGTFAVVMSWSGNVPSNVFWGVLGICAIIPLLIAPPISLFALSILRILTQTIDKVDNYVRFDTLTGLLTRAYLLGQIRDRLDAGGSFLMVDADHFKAINDTYGHDIGDEALKKIAEVMRAANSLDALIGRLGGEEFGIFLPGATDAEAAVAATRLCEAMRLHGKTIAGYDLCLTVSIGGAMHLPNQPLEKTMQIADVALYQAKNTGRDRYFIANGSDTMPALVLKTRIDS